MATTHMRTANVWGSMAPASMVGNPALRVPCVAAAAVPESKLYLVGQICFSWSTAETGRESVKGNGSQT